MSELKKITRCGNCLQKGHWHEECPNPYKPRSSGPEGQQKGGGSKGNGNGFAFLGLHTSSSSGSAMNHTTYMSDEIFEKVSSSSWLAIPAGMAIVDPGASQDLIGKKAFDELTMKLAQVGLKPVVLQETPSPASGIGGRAEPLFTALTPCMLGETPGIVKLTVLREDIPQLLSIGLLEMARSVIDTDRNEIHFRAFETSAPLVRLESGHRLLDISSWSGGPFPVPARILEQFQLDPGAFNLPDSATASEYMASSSDRSSYFHEIVGRHESWSHDSFGNVVFKGWRKEFQHSVLLEAHNKKFRSTWGLLGNWFVPLERNIATDQACTVAVDEFHGFVVSVFFHDINSSSLPSSSFPVDCSEWISRFSLSGSKEESKENHEELQQPVKSHRSSEPLQAQQLSVIRDCENSSPGDVPKHHERLVLDFNPFQNRTSSIGARYGTGSSELVWPHNSAAGEEEGRGQSSVGSDGDAGRVCSDSLLSSGGGEWSKPIRALDKMSPLQGEVKLHGLRSIEPQDQGQAEQTSDHLCPSAQDDCYELFGLREGEEQGEESQGGGTSGLDSERASRSFGETSGILGGRDPTSFDSSGRIPSATAEHSANHGSLELGSTDIASATSDAGAALQHGGQGRGDDQPQWLGDDAASSVSSGVSFVRHSQVSPMKFDGSAGSPCQLTSLFGPHILKYLSDRMYSFHVYQAIDGNIRVFWEDRDLCLSLIDSDNFDDQEFQVTHKQKRFLKQTVHEKFLTEANLVGHFVDEEVDVRDKNGTQQQGEDLRTSRKLQEPRARGEDLRTSRNSQEPVARGEDLRTSRKSQEPRAIRDGEDDRTSRASAREEGPRTSSNTSLAVEGSVENLFEGSVGPATHGKCFSICELFSPPRVGPVARAAGLKKTSSFDLRNGWDFFCARDRANFWKFLHEERPDLVTMSPECKAFSQLMNVNWLRMDEEHVKRLQQEGLAMLHFCVQVAEFQLAHGAYFLLEHPGGATSWRTHAVTWLLDQKGVIRFLFDQCAVGLSVVDGVLSKKTTGILTNHIGIASLLSQCQCTGDHEHQRLENGLTSRARIYPDEMIQKIVDGIIFQNKGFKMSFNFVELEDEEIVDEETEVMEQNNNSEAEDRITALEKDKVRALHNNLGHVPAEKMLTLLKAAGAKSRVLHYVKQEFSCNQCMRQQQPITRRKAAYPRTFSFNRILGLDIVYVSFLGKTVAMLNVVCHGTNLQQIGFIRGYESGTPNSKATWKCFNDLWLRPFGLPEVVQTDGGGEFRFDFERHLEQCGCLHVVSDSHSPWQNGRVERHGGWLKQRLEQEVQSGQSTVSNLEELEILVTSLVSHKNRYFHRGGYSPYQLTFGVNPRVPVELLSDDPLQAAGLSEVIADDFELDSAAQEFNRAHTIRQRARELCMKQSAKDKVRLSSQSILHKQRQWHAGQWVYVWRKFAGTGQGHFSRSRWTGPGLVIAQQGHSVWVSMRSRLLKCNSDQLRPASHDEAIGAELQKSGEIRDLLHQASSHRAGAVDVASEGAPGDEAWDQPVAREEAPQVIMDRHEPLQPIAEEGEIENTISPPALQDHGLLRDVAIDVAPATPLPGAAPATPLPAVLQRPRQMSVQTADEPLAEPRPEVSRTPSESERSGTLSVASEPKRRRRTSNPGVVTQRVEAIENTENKRKADSELQRLERQAVRELRRLRREEREAAARSSTDVIPTPEISRDSSTQQGDQSASTVGDDVPEPDLTLPGDNMLNFLEISIQGQNLVASQANVKNSEFNMKQADHADILGFRSSDKAEWDAIVKLGAVKILSKSESASIRSQLPHRIITSRMVRRKKPTPGVGNFKFKSRWCVHGHKDPDSFSLKTYSPMPTTESISMFFQLCINLDLKVSLADVSNAFCQSNKLDRPAGKLYVSPCEGLSLDPNTLIELVVPVYGLDDAPIRWHHTLLEFFTSIGFTRSLLEPCWLVKREKGRVIAMVLIEVDDINVGVIPGYQKELQELMTQRFSFGKWEHDEADFAGRHVRILPDRALLDQEKYILEKIVPIKVSRGRLSDKTSRLEEDEFTAYRSLLYKINWVAHQTRPEAAGVVSLLSSRLQQATIYDLGCLNRLAAHLRNTAQQCLCLHKFDCDKMVFIAASDAGGVDSVPKFQVEDQEVPDTVQGAWVIMASDSLPAANSRVKVSILSWRSSKLKRRVSSTLAGEALAFSQALGEMEWLQVMVRDIVHGDVNRVDWRKSLLPFIGILKEDCELKQRLDQCGVTDAKSLYDAILKENPTSRQDRRTSVELAIISESMAQSKSVLRWTPHPKMIADTLTKDDISKTNGALEEVLKTGRLSLWEESAELARRKDPQFRGRSKRASGLIRDCDLNLLSMLDRLHVNRDIGELLNCTSTLLTSD